MAVFKAGGWRQWTAVWPITNAMIDNGRFLDSEPAASAKIKVPVL